MIGVGVNENIYLFNASLDEKDTLSLIFKEAGKEEKVYDPFAALGASEVIEKETNEFNVRIFPPSPPKEDSDLTEEKKIDRAVGDINGTKGILRHLLMGYMPTDDIKFDPYAGLDISRENFAQKILSKEGLAHIHKNLCNQFLGQVRPFLDKKDQVFRLLLVRQSKDKHYATFRKRFLDDNPMWESMTIPKDQSKLKFNDYEKSQGLDNGTPASRESADSKGAAQAPATVQSVFG
jgi:hypothetical protein